MQPENVNSIFAIGQNFDYELFQAAIYFAENGSHVWFIAPRVFEKLPENLKPPDKEVLQFITFLYLRDYNDLMKYLHGIHLWRKTPSLMIMSGFEHYTHFPSTFDVHLAASIAANLLDSAAVCAQKNKQTTNLLVACSSNANDVEKLQVIKDLYFSNYIHQTEGNFTQDIIQLLN